MRRKDSRTILFAALIAENRRSLKAVVAVDHKEAAEDQTDRCLMRFVQNAEKKRKFLLSRLKIVRFIAEIASHHTEADKKSHR